MKLGGRKNIEGVEHSWNMSNDFFFIDWNLFYWNIGDIDRNWWISIFTNGKKRIVLMLPVKDFKGWNGSKRREIEGLETEEKM